MERAREITRQRCDEAYSTAVFSYRICKSGLGWEATNESHRLGRFLQEGCLVARPLRCPGLNQVMQGSVSIRVVEGLSSEC
jgi:hypothetical protein